MNSSFDKIFVLNSSTLVSFIALLFAICFIVPSCAKEVKQDSCLLCKEIVEIFHKGMNETSNKSYNSGSIEWVRQNLGKYENSETRFISIMEGICRDSKNKIKCKAFVEKFEDQVENWFMKQRMENVTLFDFLCIQEAEVCCAQYHYGKECNVCLGYIGDVLCSGHGDCVGDGTRKGNGSCQCSRGYNGTLCELCAQDFYQSEDGSCLPCHNSCTGPCVNHTIEGCLGSCKEGWVLDSNGKCKDIDECSQDKNPCKEGQRCLNVPGKYYCRDCHQGCQTCNGDEEDKCITCKPGYEKDENNKCIDVDECSLNKYECKPMTYCDNKPGGYKCKKCHKACKDGCTGSGPESCIACKSGYRLLESGKGCVDINECDQEKNICPEGKYCLNKEGSYKCRKCDEACSLCHGPGAYSCFACSHGYKMVKGLCTDGSKIKQTEMAEDEEDL